MWCLEIVTLTSGVFIFKNLLTIVRQNLKEKFSSSGKSLQSFIDNGQNLKIQESHQKIITALQ
jgi:hypothetical protein